MVIDHARRHGPRLAPWNYWHARTRMLAWMLPRAARAGQWRQALGLAVDAYVLNPLWWVKPEPWTLIGRTSKTGVAEGLVSGAAPRNDASSWHRLLISLHVEVPRRSRTAAVASSLQLPSINVDLRCPGTLWCEGRDTARSLFVSSSFSEVERYARLQHRLRDGAGARTCHPHPEPPGQRSERSRDSRSLGPDPYEAPESPVAFRSTTATGRCALACALAAWWPESPVRRSSTRCISTRRCRPSSPPTGFGGSQRPLARRHAAAIRSTR